MPLMRSESRSRTSPLTMRTIYLAGNWQACCGELTAVLLAACLRSILECRICLQGLQLRKRCRAIVTHGVKVPFSSASEYQSASACTNVELSNG